MHYKTWVSNSRTQTPKKMHNTTQELKFSEIKLLLFPLAFAVFVLGLVFNTLLLVLICKACKVNNNTIVYLFSLGITGLMRTFVAFTLIVTLAVDDWVLGKGICSINQMFSKLLFGASLLFLGMSHDRYRAVKYSFTYWKVKRHITIIINIVIWIVSLILGLPGSVLLFPSFLEIIIYHGQIVLSEPVNFSLCDLL